MHDDTNANEKRKLKLRFQNIFSKCFHLHVWCRRRCYVLDAAIRSDGMRERVEGSAHGVAKYYLDKRETSCSTVVWTANKIRQLCEFYFFANFFSLFFLLFLGQIHFVVSSYCLFVRDGDGSRPDYVSAARQTRKLLFVVVQDRTGRW